TNTITLEDDTESAVAAMLCFMYASDYNDDDMEAQESVEPLTFNVHVYAIADKYDIPSLAKLATAKFAKRAAQDWHKVCFAEAASLASTTSASHNNPLLDIIASVAVDHAKELKDTEAGRRFENAVQAVPTLGLALWQKHIEKSLEPRKQYSCPNCHWMVPADRIGCDLWGGDCMNWAKEPGIMDCASCPPF
ncbi:hypothetical protein LTR53_014950, partial [Teratosphaeriaceae sp. CCFEE 6253]